MSLKQIPSGQKEFAWGPETASRGRRACLLVIEDDGDIREFLQLLLGEEYVVVGRPSGGRILETIDGYRPDLVILDVNLPGKDGFELCRMIRSSPRHRELPVLLLTVRRDDASFLKSVEVAADACLNKPFDPAELKVAIARLIC